MMNQLHLIQKQIDLLTFEQNLNRYTEINDTIIFLNDGLFSLVDKELQSEIFDRKNIRNSIVVLEEQVVARAIQQLIHSEIKQIDYSSFVDLSANARKIVSW